MPAQAITGPVASRSRVLVVAHDVEELAPLEGALEDLLADDWEVHVVLTDDDASGHLGEFAPRRLRLMLLLARLADRELAVRGEDGYLGDGLALIGVAAAVDPDVVRTLGVTDPTVLGALAAIGVPVLPLALRGGEDRAGGVVVGA